MAYQNLRQKISRPARLDESRWPSGPDPRIDPAHRGDDAWLGAPRGVEPEVWAARMCEADMRALIRADD